uniref:DNA helicase Pif1-like 2B domain-containing protein n=1 Tax=Manihot esculenta TaxID=3983 RepID=A0A2C9VEH9_MANES
MHLLQSQLTITIEKTQIDFAEWILSIGDDELLINNTSNVLASIISRVYYNFIEKHDDVNFLKERAIVTPMDGTVEEHKVSLKINTLIILLRNLNPSLGLYNGTRLLIREFDNRIIKAEIISGSYAGVQVCIPRIILSMADKKMAIYIEKKFSVKICYCMTINKTQGQTLKYEVISRVTSKYEITIAIEKYKSEAPDGYIACTKNIVYSEIFEDLNASIYV